MNTRASWWSIGRRIAVIFFVLSTFTLPMLAATNTWINPTGGRWDDANSWSLGLPNSSQSIEITNSSAMSVVIDADTAQQNASSMTVSNLLVNSGNELIITNAGTNVPLHVLGTVSGYQNGFLLMYDSAFQAQNLSLIDTYQNGGVAQIGTMTLANASSYTLSYGALQCSQADLITSPFYQYGGVANIGAINLYEGPYRLNNGLLFSSNIYLNGQMSGSTFVQQGGTNSVGSLTVNAISRSSYYLTNGVINAGNLSVIVGYGTESANFYQQGGTVFVTNSLSLQGAGYHYPWEGTPARYVINDGALVANAIVFNGQGGPGSMDIVNSTVSVAGSLDFRGVTYAPGNVSLQSGTLRCANVINEGGVVSITQSGGSFIVSNLFVFSGYYPIPLYGPTLAATYNFSGGTLAANNIEIDAQMVIGDSAQAGRIFNPGYFRLAGTLGVGNAHETLGQFILASQTVTNYEMPSASLVVRTLTNAVINFTGGNSLLAFADSHSITWSNAATLYIVNWAGALQGGGNQQLKFGTTASGLTTSQLSHIRFVNPDGFPNGTYAATILNTGEVVPYAPEVSIASNGNRVVITWPDNTYSLQFATNVLGPWTNVVASSPYTNNFAGTPQGFFRLER